MTKYNDLQSLKTIAKRLARQERIAHHEALDWLAQHLGQAHWNALTVAWDKNWRPAPDTVQSLLSAKEPALPDVMSIPVLGLGFGKEEHGVIDGYAYSLQIDFEVLMGGDGWCICIEQPPSKAPLIEVYDERDQNPIRNAEFKKKALALCYQAAEHLRARIASDWPRRSTKPDAQGRAQHPLSKGISSKWHCLYCDGILSGIQMAENLWHCPKCNATPIDIFSEPFWKAA